MNKEKYDRAELELIRFQMQDVLTGSDEEYEDDELPFVPNPKP